MVVHGPSNTTVRRASLDLNKGRLDFDLDIPLLRIDGLYNLKGQILLLPLFGQGKLRVNFILSIRTYVTCKIFSHYTGDVGMTLKNVKTTVKTKFSLKNLPEVRYMIPR